MADLWRGLAALSAAVSVVIFAVSLQRSRSIIGWPERRDALGRAAAARWWTSPRLVATRLIRCRAARNPRPLEAGLELTLLALAAELEAGTSLAAALARIAGDLPEPAATELRQALERAPVGDGVAIVRRWSEFRSNTTLQDLAAILSLHRGTGGSLAPVFHRLATATRQRRLLQARANARSAEARLSAIILAAAPGAIALFIGVTQTELLKPLWQESTGRFALAYALVSWTVGVVWIRQMLSAINRLGIEQ